MLSVMSKDYDSSKNCCMKDEARLFISSYSFPKITLVNLVVFLDRLFSPI